MGRLVTASTGWSTAWAAALRRRDAIGLSTLATDPPFRLQDRTSGDGRRTSRRGVWAHSGAGVNATSDVGGATRIAQRAGPVARPSRQLPTTLRGMDGSIRRGLMALAWDPLRGDTSIGRTGGSSSTSSASSANRSSTLAVAPGILLDFLTQGVDIDGVEISAEMLAICRTKADIAGINVDGRLQAGDGTARPPSPLPDDHHPVFVVRARP